VSAFSDVRLLGPQQIWPGLTGRTVHGDQLTMSLLELEPDIEVPEHSHENEQAGLLIEGSVRFRIGEETGELGPGETWLIRANVPHSVKAGPVGAVIVEVFSPPRHDWSAYETQEPRPARWPAA
jgi:quercetin dioxygenase-like cupin family protein